MNAVAGQRLWLIIAQSCVLSLVVVAVIRMNEARSAFDDATANRETCRRLADEIQQLRQLTSVADEEQADSEMGNSHVVKLALECGINQSQLRAIQRYAPERIESTDYQREDLSVEVGEATILQLVKLALRLDQSRQSAKLTSLSVGSHRQRDRRRSAAGTAPAELWNGQLILTQLTYTARSASR